MYTLALISPGCKYIVSMNDQIEGSVITNHHLQAVPIAIAGLEVPHMHKRRQALLVVGEIGPTVRYAAILTGLCGPWSTAITRRAKDKRYAALTPDVTARIQRTWVEIRQLISIVRLGSAWNLWATYFV